MQWSCPATEKNNVRLEHKILSDDKYLNRIAVEMVWNASLAYQKCTLKHLHFYFYWQFVQAEYFNQAKFAVSMRRHLRPSKWHLLITLGRDEILRGRMLLLPHPDHKSFQAWPLPKEGISNFLFHEIEMFHRNEKKAVRTFFFLIYKLFHWWWQTSFLSWMAMESVARLHLPFSHGAPSSLLLWNH